MDDDAQHALDEVLERGEPVHPGAPEMHHRGVGHDDTAEADDEGEEGRDEQRGEQLVRRERRDELAQPDVEHLVQHDEHPGEAGGERVAREPEAPVPAVEVERPGDDGVGQLREDGACHEGDPRVDLGFGLAGFVEVAKMKELGLQLLDERWGNGECHEDGEEARLHVDVTVFQVPESEGVEETGEDVKHELALGFVSCVNVELAVHTYQGVLRVPPVGDKGTLRHGPNLHHDGHRVLTIIVLFSRVGLVAACFDDVVNLL